MQAYWSIPFPRHRKKKKRQQQQRQQQGARRPREGAARPPPVEAARPSWDSTTSDHSKYKLSEAEQVGLL